MSRKDYEGEGVPDRLQNKTIETMLPDTLYLPAVDSFTGMNEVFYIDKNQASGLGRLVVDGRQDLRLVEPADSLDEMVVLMKVWAQDSNGELREYIIADCRHCDDHLDLIGDDSEVDFTDQETAWGEIDYIQHRVIVSAVIDNRGYGKIDNRDDGKIDSIDDGKIGVWGDPDLYDAAIHMARMVDEALSGHDRAAISEVSGKEDDTNQLRLRTRDLQQD